MRLQDAFHAAQKDDVIEVRTDGPSAGGTLGGPDRDMTLTVRAAPGYRPVISKQVLVNPAGATFDSRA